MSGQELYDMLPEHPTEVLLHWREIRKKIHDEFDKATTDDQRGALLQLFTVTMNIVEPTIAQTDLETFRKARQQDYNLFIVKESLVGQNVCAETADAVTRREVAAGRMAPDHDLRQLAEAAMAAPHLTRAQLVAKEEQKFAPKPADPVRRIFSWFRGR